jgi:hypothetical protein
VFLSAACLSISRQNGNFVDWKTDGAKNPLTWDLHHGHDAASLLAAKHNTTQLFDQRRDHDWRPMLA